VSPGRPVAGSAGNRVALMGIPAVAMSGGVAAAGAEYQPAGEWKEPQSLLLAALALSGLAGINQPLLEIRPPAPVKAPALR
jgi:hypothetical protein